MSKRYFYWSFLKQHLETNTAQTRPEPSLLETNTKTNARPEITTTRTRLEINTAQTCLETNKHGLDRSGDKHRPETSNGWRQTLSRRNIAQTHPETNTVLI